jgi:hypothetical protein
MNIKNTSENTVSDKKGESFKYKCITKCTFNGKFYRPLEIMILTEKKEEKELPYFQLI